MMLGENTRRVTALNKQIITARDYATFGISSCDIFSVQDVSGGCFDETITAKLKYWERMSQS